jgi:hypothetical protein
MPRRADSDTCVVEEQVDGRRPFLSWEGNGQRPLAMRSSLAPGRRSPLCRGSPSQPRSVRTTGVSLSPPDESIAKPLSTSRAFGARRSCGGRFSNSVQISPFPGERWQKVDLSLPDSDSFAAETLERIQKRAGADLVILGSYLALGDKMKGEIRLDLKLQDTAEARYREVNEELEKAIESFSRKSGIGAKLRKTWTAPLLSLAKSEHSRNRPRYSISSAFFSSPLMNSRTLSGPTTKPCTFLEKSETSTGLQAPPSPARTFSGSEGTWPRAPPLRKGPDPMHRDGPKTVSGREPIRHGPRARVSG